MKKDITPYFQPTPEKYLNLQKYDYTEFSGKKHQAIDASFNNENYKNIRFKNGQYKECKFNNCDFNAAGLSGTSFISCTLKDFTIFDSNLQFCEFSKKCTLEGVHKKSLINSSNLSQSVFYDSEIKNILIKSTTISQAHFKNDILNNVTWESCTLQDNLFDNITMKDVSLVGCNLEYSEFRNMEMKNVKLPLHQIPYTFGLLNCLKTFPEDILIDAINSNSKALTPKEYIQLLPDLLRYYIDMTEYFPAINILLFNEDFEEASSVIDTSMLYYISTNNFRKIKGMCKLISENPYYDRHYKTQLYFKLVEYYNTIDISEYNQYQYALHIDDIKKLLTDFNNTMPIAHFYLKTNITSDNTNNLAIFYQTIEECMKEYGISTEEYIIEIRHNSATLSFWIKLINANKKQIICAIGMLKAIITGDPAYLINAISTISNIVTISSFALQVYKNLNTKENTLQLDTINIPNEKIKEKNKLLKNSKINVEITLPFFNFSYHSEKQYEHQS